MIAPHHMQRLPAAPLLAGLLAALLLGFTSVAEAQEVHVRASTPSSTVAIGDVVPLTVEVQGTSLTNLETPPAPVTTNLVAETAAPTLRREAAFEDGAILETIVYRWAYRPLRRGMATIDPVEIVIDGERHQTAPIELTVMEQGDRPIRDNRAVRAGRAMHPTEETDRSDVFLRAESNARSVYAGEEVVVEYQLLFREPLRPRGSRLAEISSAEGLWKEELDVDMRPEPTEVTHDGQRYHMIILKRAAFFPTRPGNFTLSPMRIRTEMDTRRASAYGRRSGAEEVELSSAPLELEARPLPEEAPPAFRGAVGNYNLETTLSEQHVEVDEALEIELRIEGAGNLALLEAPILEVGETAELMGPRISSELNRSGASLRGTRSFIYTLIPREAGTLELPDVSLTYFDPSTGRYLTDESALPTVTVVERSAPVADSPAAGNEELWSWLSRVTGGLLAFLILAGLAFAAYQLVLTRREEASSVGLTEDKVRQERAERFLQQAEQARQRSDPRRCFRCVEQALATGLEPYLQGPPGELTRSEIQLQLEASGLPRRLTRQVQNLLEACDRAQYSPEKQLDVEHILPATRRCIVALVQRQPSHSETRPS